jgi:hypothetical protein
LPAGWPNERSAPTRRADSSTPAEQRRFATRTSFGTFSAPES